MFAHEHRWRLNAAIAEQLHPKPQKNKRAGCGVGAGISVSGRTRFHSGYSQLSCSVGTEDDDIDVDDLSELTGSVCLSQGAPSPSQFSVSARATPFAGEDPFALPATQHQQSAAAVRKTSLPQSPTGSEMNANSRVQQQQSRPAGVQQLLEDLFVKEPLPTATATPAPLPLPLAPAARAPNTFEPAAAYGWNEHQLSFSPQEVNQLLDKLQQDMISHDHLALASAPSPSPSATLAGAGSGFGFGWAPPFSSCTAPAPAPAPATTTPFANEYVVFLCFIYCNSFFVSTANCESATRAALPDVM